MPPKISNIPSAHHLVGRYTTHQPDGVHIQARCTCGLKLEGVGADESLASNSLWKLFNEHLQKSTGQPKGQLICMN